MHRPWRLSQTFAPLRHSFASAQTVPFPIQPAVQVHWNEPVVSVQVAWTSQLSVLYRHSSTLLQAIVPGPVHPELQAHKKEPAALMQLAWATKLCAPAHSLTSAQANPVPVQPALHAQANDDGVSMHVACAWQLWLFIRHSFRLGHDRRAASTTTTPFAFELLTVTAKSPRAVREKLPTSPKKSASTVFDWSSVVLTVPAAVLTATHVLLARWPTAWELKNSSRKYVPAVMFAKENVAASEPLTLFEPSCNKLPA